MDRTTALTVEHVCIDYRDISHMSLAKSLKRGEVKKITNIRAVNDISFSVQKGEILGIIGRNGSGKTTLLRSIAGIFQPDEGEIDLHGNRASLMAIGIGFNGNNTGRENILKSGMLLGCKLSYVNLFLSPSCALAEASGTPYLVDPTGTPPKMYRFPPLRDGKAAAEAAACQCRCKMTNL